MHYAPGFDAISALPIQETLPAQQCPLANLSGIAADVGGEPIRRHRFSGYAKQRNHRLIQTIPIAPTLGCAHHFYPRLEVVVVAFQSLRHMVQSEWGKAGLSRGDIGNNIVEVLEVPL